MIWLMQILRIYLEETATDKAFNIAKIQNMTNRIMEFC